MRKSEKKSQAKHNGRGNFQFQNQISCHPDGRLSLSRDIVAYARGTDAQDLRQLCLSDTQFGHAHFNNIAKARLADGEMFLRIVGHQILKQFQLDTVGVCPRCGVINEW